MGEYAGRSSAAGAFGIRENWNGQGLPSGSSSRRAGSKPDWSSRALSRTEKVRITGEYLLLDVAVSLLFYRSILVFILLLPGLWIYFRRRKEAFRKKQEARMRREFLDGMQFAGTALQAGYAMENAFSEALEELVKLYDEDSFIIQEFRLISVQVRLNVPVEKLLADLGQRSHIDDIRNFADVFLTARRTGGDMIAIVRSTIAGMQQKEETRLEIETVLAGKKMEQTIMSVIPLAILLFVSVTDPGFLSGMYHTPEGILVMTGCLGVYAAAWLWGRKIMEIEV